MGKSPCSFLALPVIAAWCSLVEALNVLSNTHSWASWPLKDFKNCDVTDLYGTVGRVHSVDELAESLSIVWYDHWRTTTCLAKKQPDQLVPRCYFSNVQCWVPDKPKSSRPGLEVALWPQTRRFSGKNNVVLQGDRGKLIRFFRDEDDESPSYNQYFVCVVWFSFYRKDCFWTEDWTKEILIVGEAFEPSEETNGFEFEALNMGQGSFVCYKGDRGRVVNLYSEWGVLWYRTGNFIAARDLETFDIRVISTDKATVPQIGDQLRCHIRHKEYPNNLCTTDEDGTLEVKYVNFGTDKEPDRRKLPKDWKSNWQTYMFFQNAIAHHWTVGETVHTAPGVDLLGSGVGRIFLPDTIPTNLCQLVGNGNICVRWSNHPIGSRTGPECTCFSQKHSVRVLAPTLQYVVPTVGSTLEVVNWPQGWHRKQEGRMEWPPKDKLLESKRGPPPERMAVVLDFIKDDFGQGRMEVIGILRGEIKTSTYSVPWSWWPYFFEYYDGPWTFQHEDAFVTRDKHEAAARIYCDENNYRCSLQWNNTGPKEEIPEKWFLDYDVFQMPMLGEEVKATALSEEHFPGDLGRVVICRHSSVDLCATWRRTGKESRLSWTWFQVLEVVGTQITEDKLSLKTRFRAIRDLDATCPRGSRGWLSRVNVGIEKKMLHITCGRETISFNARSASWAADYMLESEDVFVVELTSEFKLIDVPSSLENLTLGLGDPGRVSLISKTGFEVVFYKGATPVTFLLDRRRLEESGDKPWYFYLMPSDTPRKLQLGDMCETLPTYRSSHFIQGRVILLYPNVAIRDKYGKDHGMRGFWVDWLSFLEPSHTLAVGDEVQRLNSEDRGRIVQSRNQYIRWALYKDDGQLKNLFEEGANETWYREYWLTERAEKLKLHTEVMSYVERDLKQDEQGSTMVKLSIGAKGRICDIDEEAGTFRVQWYSPVDAFDELPLKRWSDVLIVVGKPVLPHSGLQLELLRDPGIQGRVGGRHREKEYSITWYATGEREWLPYRDWSKTYKVSEEAGHYLLNLGDIVQRLPAPDRLGGEQGQVSMADTSRPVADNQLQVAWYSDPERPETFLQVDWTEFLRFESAQTLPTLGDKVKMYSKLDSWHASGVVYNVDRDNGGEVYFDMLFSTNSGPLSMSASTADFYKYFWKTGKKAIPPSWGLGFSVLFPPEPPARYRAGDIGRISHYHESNHTIEIVFFGKRDWPVSITESVWYSIFNVTELVPPGPQRGLEVRFAAGIRGIFGRISEVISNTSFCVTLYSTGATDCQRGTLYSLDAIVLEDKVHELALWEEVQTFGTAPILGRVTSLEDESRFNVTWYDDEGSNVAYEDYWVTKVRYIGPARQPRPGDELKPLKGGAAVLVLEVNEEFDRLLFATTRYNQSCQEEGSLKMWAHQYRFTSLAPEQDEASRSSSLPWCEAVEHLASTSNPISFVIWIVSILGAIVGCTFLWLWMDNVHRKERDRIRREAGMGIELSEFQRSLPDPVFIPFISSPEEEEEDADHMSDGSFLVTVSNLDRELQKQRESEEKRKRRKSLCASDKFDPSANVPCLISGQPQLAAGDITYFLGMSNDSLERKLRNPLEAVRFEFQQVLELEEDNEKRQMCEEMLTYILDKPALPTLEQSNDGHSTVERDAENAGLFLVDFSMKPEALKARLTLAEVAALRIYTSCLFSYINGPFRRKENLLGFQEPHPVAVTVTLIRDGIRKLRANHVGEAQNSAVCFWRGMKDLQIPKDFETEGGTELTCMSTTADLKIAGQYGQSENPLIFCVHSKNFMDRGVDISWLSLYNHEKEMLYPPLTYLHCRGKRRIKNLDTGWVVDVEPVMN